MDQSGGTVREQLDQAIRSREHTQDWYARHYGKLHDWARKRLPEPWQTEFFNCVANGTWGNDDLGEPYMSQVGRIVPSGYFKMDDAAAQLLHDQTKRAELAELKLEAWQASARERENSGDVIQYADDRCRICNRTLHEHRRDICQLGHAYCPPLASAREAQRDK